MHTRSPVLQAVVDAAAAAFSAYAIDKASRISVSRSFAALTEAREPSDHPGSRLSVCDRWLPVALTSDTLPPGLRRLAEAFLAVEPAVRWQRRDGCEESHANAMLIGPGGIEQRTDVWLGASLLAPGVRYPDHTHPPEETYLIFGPGQFSQEGGPWFEPGVGGVFRNEPGVLHAMKAGAVPLFAFWLLRSEEA